MSRFHRAAAWESSERKPIARFLLVTMGDMASEEGLCWASVATLAERTEICDRSVQAALAALVERGHISYAEGDRSRGGPPGQRSTTLYRIHPQPCPFIAAKKDARRASYEPPLPGLEGRTECTGAGDAPVQEMHGCTECTGASDAGEGCTRCGGGVHEMRGRGASDAPKQVLNRNRTVNEPSASAREGTSSAPNEPLQTEQRKWAARIVDTYPANGSRYTALGCVIDALKAGQDPAALLAMVQRHAERWKALTVEERRYCPGKPAYFRDERWRDNPEASPWRNSGVSSSVRVEKKEGAPPDALELQRLAAARALWPALPGDVRWRDLAPGKQRKVEAHMKQGGNAA